MSTLAVVCALGQRPGPVLSLSTLTFLSLSCSEQRSTVWSADTFGLDLLMLRCVLIPLTAWAWHVSYGCDWIYLDFVLGLSNKGIFLFPMAIVISPHYTLRIPRTTFVLWALATPAALAKPGIVATKVAWRLGHVCRCSFWHKRQQVEIFRIGSVFTPIIVSMSDPEWSIIVSMSDPEWSGLWSRLLLAHTMAVRSSLWGLFRFSPPDFLKYGQMYLRPLPVQTTIQQMCNALVRSNLCVWGEEF